MYQLHILHQARQDIQNSAAWYNEQREGLGEKFILEVIRTLKRTEKDPLHYPEKFNKQFRFAKVDTFPFLVIFKVKGETVVINAVFHTSRKPDKFR